jgi:hypothetical protein
MPEKRVRSCPRRGDGAWRASSQAATPASAMAARGAGTRRVTRGQSTRTSSVPAAKSASGSRAPGKAATIAATRSW